MTATLVLCRHGQSDWNLKNLFTGWRDPDLSEKGIAEAHTAGQRLNALGLKFDIAFTSVLIKSLRKRLRARRFSFWRTRFLAEREWATFVRLLLLRYRYPDGPFASRGNPAGVTDCSPAHATRGRRRPSRGCLAAPP